MCVKYICTLSPTNALNHAPLLSHKILARSVAERLESGDEHSARLLLHAAMRCSAEHTLLALAIPTGSPPFKGKHAGPKDILRDVGVRIAIAIETGPVLKLKAAENKKTQHPQKRMPPLVRLCARLCIAGRVGAAAEWAHLVSATHASVKSMSTGSNLPPLHSRTRTSKSPVMAVTTSPASLDFQEAVPALLEDDEVCVGG